MKNKHYKTKKMKGSLQKRKPRPLQLILSTYFWPVLFVVMCVVFIFRPTWRIHHEVNAKTKSTMNKTMAPDFIAHITDIHLSEVDVAHAGKVWKVFHKVSEVFKPEAVILTGDISDGKTTQAFLGRHAQFEQNWRPYLQIVKDHPNLKIIACAGNHDEVLVSSVNASDHIYNNIVNEKKNEEFFLRTFYVETNQGTVRVIRWNPFRFPMPPTPLYLFGKPTKKMLDDLEEALKPDNKSIFTIVGCHYPLQSIEKVRSSSGRKTEEILANAHVRYFLTGHFHIPESFVQRFGHDSIETIGASLAKSNSIAFVAIDNNISSYQNVDCDENTPYIMTIPPPDNQFIESSNYLGETFRARITVFSHMPATISLSVDGNFIGEMEEDLRTDNYITYGIDVHTTNGYHKLSTDGDVVMERSFIVGSKDMGTIDIGLIFFLHYQTLMNIGIIVLFATIAAFILPIILDIFFAKQFTSYGCFLFNTFYGTSKGPCQISFRRPKLAATSCFCIAGSAVKSIIIGPWYTIWRSHFMPRKNKILLYIMFAQSFIIPLYVVQCNKDWYQAVTLIGYQTNRSIMPDAFCFIVNCGYQLTLLWPLNFLGGLYTEAYRWSMQLTIDFIIWILLIYGYFAIMASALIPGKGIVGFLTSPIVIVTFIETVVFLKSIFRENKVLRSTSMSTLSAILSDDDDDSSDAKEHND